VAVTTLGLAREGTSTKLSARNILKGKIVEVVRGQVTAQL
jgi:hypothetical protein